MPNIKKEEWEAVQNRLTEARQEVINLTLRIQEVESANKAIDDVIRGAILKEWPTTYHTFTELNEMCTSELRQLLITTFENYENREAELREQISRMEIQVERMQEQIERDIQPLKDKIISLVMNQ